MIECLELKNFQSHEYSRLEFSPGVNMIVGSSDSGKTAIIRALNWVVNNRPAGDSFRSKFGNKLSKETKTILSIDGTEIIRSKSDKENYYLLNEVEFKAMGQGVPDDVSSFLNFSNINIQYQMDSPFLLSESSGEVARYFNKVVNLEKIDEALKAAASKIKKTEMTLKLKEEDLTRDTEKLQEYNWIEAAEKDFKKIELIANKERDARKAFASLSEIIDSAQQISEHIIDIDYTKAEKDIKNLLAAEEKRKQISNKKQDLDLLLTSIERTKEIANDIDYKKAEKSLNFIFILNSSAAELYNNIEELNIIIKSITSLTEKKERIKTTIDNTEQALQEIMPDICPLCGQETHGQNI